MKAKWIGLFVLGIVLYQYLPSSPRVTWSGKCVGVTDGDTIRVMHAGRERAVRLEEIDCPEFNQDFGTKAKQFTSRMVFGKIVSVADKGQDRYGRTIGRVFVDGNDLSFDLVRAGLAWHYWQYSSELKLAAAEAFARLSGAGLWAMPAPVPPWDFRMSERERRTAPAAAGGYHGNRRSHVFHAPGCRYYDCKNCVVVFRSRQEALAAGFRPHRGCVR